VTPASTASYVLCGTLQVLLFLGFSYLGAFVLVAGLEWIAITAGTGFSGIYWQAFLFGGMGLVVMCVAPILAKWLLIGRWKREEFPVWSLAYFRFWLVKALVRSSPLVLFAGSPIYLLYLRALGARIGRGVVIFSGNVPVCTDLLTVGGGTCHPQGRALRLLPGARRPDPDGCGQPRRGGGRRRADGDRHRDLDG
jgi:non-ribosomal peptide synthetase-like protein